MTQKSQSFLKNRKQDRPQQEGKAQQPITFNIVWE